MKTWDALIFLYFLVISNSPTFSHIHFFIRLDVKERISKYDAIEIHIDLCSRTFGKYDTA